MSAFADHGPKAKVLADGRRLHLQHGPIDLVIEAFGPADSLKTAYRRSTGQFNTVLTGLVSELDVLRKPWSAGDPTPHDPIANRMWRAAGLYGNDHFVTPMIAVAGAVADHMLAQVTADRKITRAYVNNGGDIALHLSEGQFFDIGVCTAPQTGTIKSKAHITSSDCIGGIATSGWRGRSHSLGIADAVTVLADCAANADTAATLIANAIDQPGSVKIQRKPANTLAPDSDLGNQLVTVNVGELTTAEVADALDRGEILASSMAACGLIQSAFLALRDDSRIINADSNIYNSVLPGPVADAVNREVIHA